MPHITSTCSDTHYMGTTATLPEEDTGRASVIAQLSAAYTLNCFAFASAASLAEGRGATTGRGLKHLERSVNSQAEAKCKIKCNTTDPNRKSSPSRQMTTVQAASQHATIVTSTFEHHNKLAKNHTENLPWEHRNCTEPCTQADEREPRTIKELILVEETVPCCFSPCTTAERHYHRIRATMMHVIGEAESLNSQPSDHMWQRETGW